MRVRFPSITTKITGGYRLTEQIQLDEKKIMQIISEILSRGGSVEIRKRKNEIVILEVHSKTKHTVSTAG